MQRKCKGGKKQREMGRETHQQLDKNDYKKKLQKRKIPYVGTEPVTWKE